MSEHEWEEIPRRISGIRDLVCRRCGVNYLDLPDDDRRQADRQLDRIWKMSKIAAERLRDGWSIEGQEVSDG